MSVGVQSLTTVAISLLILTWLYFELFSCGVLAEWNPNKYQTYKNPDSNLEIRLIEKPRDLSLESIVPTGIFVNAFQYRHSPDESWKDIFRHPKTSEMDVGYFHYSNDFIDFSENGQIEIALGSISAISTDGHNWLLDNKTKK